MFRHTAWGRWGQGVREDLLPGLVPGGSWESRDGRTWDNTTLAGGFKHVFFSIIYGIIHDNPSHWLIFFRGVETTNQLRVCLKIGDIHGNFKGKIMIIHSKKGYLIFRLSDVWKKIWGQEAQIWLNNNHMFVQCCFACWVSACLSCMDKYTYIKQLKHATYDTQFQDQPSIEGSTDPTLDFINKCLKI